MKRIAILSLLLVPAAAVGVEQASAQAPTRVASHFDSHGDVYGDQAGAYAPSCGTVCPPACDSQGGWFGDIGYYILKPTWSGGNPAARVRATDAAAGAGNELFIQQEEFDHDYEFAPLVQVGFAGPNGLGFRTRWWTLNAADAVGASFDATPGIFVGLDTPSLLGAGATLFADDTQNIAGTARHELDLDVIDMEGLWDTTIGRTSVLYSAGVRYAHLGQHLDGNVEITDGAGVIANEGSFRASNTFNGVGPTVSMQAYRAVGNTDLSVYGLGRGSVLFGDSRERATSTDMLGNVTERTVTNDAVLPVLEMEVGANWTRNMGGFDLFAESGFVGQVWFDAGNAANSDSLLGGAIGTDNSNQDMGLVGLRYSTGIRF